MAERSRLKFKSSGTSLSARKFTNPVVVTKPIGIKTPLELGSGTDDFYKMHTDPGNQIKDNFKNLILTNFGERIGRSELGANLAEITFDLSAIEDYETEAALRIKNAAKRYIPAIALRQVLIEDATSFESSINTAELSEDSLGLTQIKLRVDYDLPSVKIFNQSIEVIIYSGG